jgi:hypothetical protein
MTEPRPSADPADYTCPRCRSGPGTRCGVLWDIKIKHPHSDRVDAMLRAHARWTKAGQA